jgi:putative DNA primase/helicase
MIDFNDLTPSPNPPREDDREALRQALLARLDSVLLTLFPAGKMRHNTFHIGDVHGSPGDSLGVVLTGEKAGLWTDRAEGIGGDIFDLIARHYGCNAHTDFATALKLASDLVGRAPAPSARQNKREAPVDELGPATAKWDYHDAHGTLIAVVYRYDPPGSKKVFRPWDVRRRKTAPPEPRPLYNQPGLLRAQQVILVEGEKCAQALIDRGVCATTAMQGANAPVDKTDWSPLAGKVVLLWPDRDKPGWDYALRAADAVLAAGATLCALLLPPDDKPEGWDVADALAEGFDVAGFLVAGARVDMPQPDDEKDADDAKAPDPSEQTVWGTEDALALAFTRRYQHHWRYVAAWGKWLMWDGRRWRGEETLAASDLIRQVCRHAAVRADSPRVATKLAGASTVSGVERLARTDRRHAGTTDEWDADIWLLNTPVGVVDLRTGRRRPHDRHDRMTKITQASASGECPGWRAFLADVTGQDPALVAYLQRMAGYCLTGATGEHAIFFLHGTGANGKSVFLNVLSTILGNYAAAAPMDTFMESRSDRHPTDLAGLRGARLVCATETEQGRRWNEAKLKVISGGDPITVRHLYQDFFTYLPHFKMLIAGNHKPAIRNVDEAMKRRLHLIPFTVRIPPEKRDGKLTEMLLKERDGILAWMLEGCLAWQQEGLRQPDKVASATQEYFEEEDAIGEFLEEECHRYAPAREAVADVFERWRGRAEKRGEYVGTSRWLVQQLLQRGFERTRLASGARAVRGLSLKPKDDGDRLPYRDA